jgi:hypothetical protein
MTFSHLQSLVLILGHWTGCQSVDGTRWSNSRTFRGSRMGFRSRGNVLIRRSAEEP